jgi:hypothetical protein
MSVDKRRNEIGSNSLITRGCCCINSIGQRQTHIMEDTKSLNHSKMCQQKQKPSSSWQEKCDCCYYRSMKSKQEWKRIKYMHFYYYCQTIVVLTWFLGIFLIVESSPVMAENHPYTNKVTLTIFDFTSWSYRAEIAGFGNPMFGGGGGDDEDDDGRLAYHAILMIPPATSSYDLQLCQVPHALSEHALSNPPVSDAASTNETLQNQGEDLSSEVTDAPSSPNLFQTSPTLYSSLPWRFRGPIALLVSLGGCDPFTKATVAVDLHQRISNDLKYIVFYNNDPNNPDNIATLSAFSGNDMTTSSNSNITTIPPWTTEQKQVMDENLVC